VIETLETTIETTSSPYSGNATSQNLS